MPPGSPTSRMYRTRLPAARVRPCSMPRLVRPPRRPDRTGSDRQRQGIHERHFRAGLESIAARHKRTRPYRPQTNGKAERFIKTLPRRWAYGPASTGRTRSASRPAGLGHPLQLERTHDGTRWHHSHGCACQQPPWESHLAALLASHVRGGRTASLGGVFQILASASGAISKSVGSDDAPSSRRAGGSTRSSRTVATRERSHEKWATRSWFRSSILSRRHSRG